MATPIGGRPFRQDGKAVPIGARPAAIGASAAAPIGAIGARTSGSAAPASSGSNERPANADRGRPLSFHRDAKKKRGPGDQQRWRGSGSSEVSASQTDGARSVAPRHGNWKERWGEQSDREDEKAPNEVVEGLEQQLRDKLRDVQMQIAQANNKVEETDGSDIVSPAPWGLLGLQIKKQEASSQIADKGGDALVDKDDHAMEAFFDSRPYNDETETSDAKHDGAKSSLEGGQDPKEMFEETVMNAAGCVGIEALVKFHTTEHATGFGSLASIECRKNGVPIHKLVKYPFAFAGMRCPDKLGAERSAAESALQKALESHETLKSDPDMSESACFLRQWSEFVAELKNDGSFLSDWEKGDISGTVSVKRKAADVWPGPAKPPDRPPSAAELQRMKMVPAPKKFQLAPKVTMDLLPKAPGLAPGDDSTGTSPTKVRVLGPGKIVKLSGGSQDADTLPRKPGLVRPIAKHLTISKSSPVVLHAVPKNAAPLTASSGSSVASRKLEKGGVVLPPPKAVGFSKAASAAAAGGPPAAADLPTPDPAIVVHVPPRPKGGPAAGSGQQAASGANAASTHPLSPGTIRDHLQPKASFAQYRQSEQIPTSSWESWEAEAEAQAQAEAVAPAEASTAHVVPPKIPAQRSQSDSSLPGPAGTPLPGTVPSLGPAATPLPSGKEQPSVPAVTPLPAGSVPPFGPPVFLSGKVQPSVRAATSSPAGTMPSPGTAATLFSPSTVTPGTAPSVSAYAPPWAPPGRPPSSQSCAQLRPPIQSNKNTVTSPGSTPGTTGPMRSTQGPQLGPPRPQGQQPGVSTSTAKTPEELLRLFTSAGSTPGTTGPMRSPQGPQLGPPRPQGPQPGVSTNTAQTTADFHQLHRLLPSQPAPWLSKPPGAPPGMPPALQQSSSSFPSLPPSESAPISKPIAQLPTAPQSSNHTISADRSTTAAPAGTAQASSAPVPKLPGDPSGMPPPAPIFQSKLAGVPPAPPAGPTITIPEHGQPTVRVPPVGKRKPPGPPPGAPPGATPTVSTPCGPLPGPTNVLAASQANLASVSSEGGRGEPRRSRSRSRGQQKGAAKNPKPPEHMPPPHLMNAAQQQTSKPQEVTASPVLSLGPLARGPPNLTLAPVSTGSSIFPQMTLPGATLPSQPNLCQPQGWASSMSPAMLSSGFLQSASMQTGFGTMVPNMTTGGAANLGQVNPLHQATVPAAAAATAAPPQISVPPGPLVLQNSSILPKPLVAQVAPVAPLAPVPPVASAAAAASSPQLGKTSQQSAAASSLAAPCKAEKSSAVPCKVEKRSVAPCKLENEEPPAPRASGVQSSHGKAAIALAAAFAPVAETDPYAEAEADAGNEKAQSQRQADAADAQTHRQRPRAEVRESSIASAAAKAAMQETGPFAVAEADAGNEKARQRQADAADAQTHRQRPRAEVRTSSIASAEAKAAMQDVQKAGSGAAAQAGAPPRPPAESQTPAQLQRLPAAVKSGQPHPRLVKSPPATPAKAESKPMQPQPRPADKAESQPAQPQPRPPDKAESQPAQPVPRTPAKADPRTLGHRSRLAPKAEDPDVVDVETDRAASSSPPVASAVRPTVSVAPGDRATSSSPPVAAAVRSTVPVTPASASRPTLPPALRPRSQQPPVQTEIPSTGSTAPAPGPAAKVVSTAAATGPAAKAVSDKTQAVGPGAKAIVPVAKAGGSGGGKADRLALVLDIDQTLVHTMKKSDFASPLNVSAYVNEDGDRELYEWPGSRGAGQADRCYVKLRPGVRAFLQGLRPYYEMSVFSMGDKEYVDFVISLIDPDRTTFHRKRIFCRKDLKSDQKHLTAINQSHSIDRIVVFDDRADNWQSPAGAQMVKAYPYKFLENLVDGEQHKDYDAHLPSVTRLLRLAHKEVAMKRSTSVMNSIRGFWSKALENLRVVIIESDGGILRSAAEAFGAIVETQVDAGLHAVVVQDQEMDDEQIDQAEELGVPLVHGFWLSFCFATFQLQDPAPFNWQGSIPPDMWEAKHQWDETMNIGDETRCPSVPQPHVWQRLEKGRLRRLAALDEVEDD